jgi:hypothetical protein
MNGRKLSSNLLLKLLEVLQVCLKVMVNGGGIEADSLYLVL